MSEIKTSKKAPAFHVLLPVCTESKVDIFLNILKCAVARSKMDEHHLTRAFMSGTKGESFAVEKDDLRLNWKQLISEEQQIRQSKIIGFWAIVNFPSLQRKLFGETHQAPSRNGVVGNTEIQAENIDELVFSKMKLRVIELSVSGSTFIKLKHFVKVPYCVGVRRSNEISISRKMVSFDVDADFVESCWDALRCGEFSMSSDYEQDVHTVMYPFVETDMGEVENHQTHTSENNRTTPQSKRPCRRHNIENVGAMNAGSVNDFEGTSVGAISVENTEGSSDSQMLSPIGNSFRQKRCYNDRDMDSEETNGGSLRAIILKLQNDIGTLSKSIQDTKDDGMARMNASANELKQANENLVNHRANLEKKIENQTTVIISLQEEIDANRSLNEKYMSDMAACLGSNEQLKIEVKRLNRKLAEAEKDVASKLKVEDELASLKSKRDSIVSELQKGIEANTSFIDKYKSDLAASLESNEQLKIETEQLYRKLAEAETKIALNKAELQKGIDANTSFNEKYKSDLAGSLESNELLKLEVERLGRNLDERNKTVEDELASLKSKSASILAELHSDIEYLQKVNSESVKENEQLKLELKNHAERNKSDVATQTGEDGHNTLSASYERDYNDKDQHNTSSLVTVQNNENQMQNAKENFKRGAKSSTHQNQNKIGSAGRGVRKLSSKYFGSNWLN